VEKTFWIGFNIQSFHTNVADDSVYFTFYIATTRQPKWKICTLHQQNRQKIQTIH